MNRKMLLGLALAVLGMASAPTAELRGAEARGLRLDQPMVIAGVYLRAAVYDVQWELQGAHAIVTFSRKSRTVATVQGELVTTDSSTANDTLYFSTRADGSLCIQALGLANTNRRVVFPLAKPRKPAAQINAASKALMENEWRGLFRSGPGVHR